MAIKKRNVMQVGDIWSIGQATFERENKRVKAGSEATNQPVYEISRIVKIQRIEEGTRYVHVTDTKTGTPMIISITGFGKKQST
ncbi:hypothetical protein [Paenibacillus gansuensis]|uniref:Uncharacterized protein n=1 Tax=Paenibacillus gansuensis TaxID=306542 RepID=A0ABW5PK55_9BACL